MLTDADAAYLSCSSHLSTQEEGETLSEPSSSFSFSVHVNSCDSAPFFKSCRENRLLL